MKKTKRFLAGVILLGLRCGSAQAAISNLQVVGVTATQAILIYQAPDLNPCTVQASESSSLTPLVHDVDPQLFAGADKDNRPGALFNGQTRVVVIGKRAAENASNGLFYSRALQTNTLHYYKITCAGGSASGSFQTANIPIGNNYSDLLPADPNNPGSYAYPSFSSTDRTEQIIDPQTGVLTKRVTLPSDRIPYYWPAFGAVDFCAYQPALDSAGRSGLHCLVNKNELVWIDTATGETRAVGKINYSGMTIITASQGSFFAFDTNGSVIQLDYNGPNLNIGFGNTLPDCRSGGPPCLNKTTLTAPGVNIDSLMAAFDLRYKQFKAPWGCGPSSVQNGRWIFGCTQSQDTPSWLGVFDPAKQNIIAALQTYGTQPMRWTGLHTLNNPGDQDWTLMSFNPLSRWSAATSPAAHTLVALDSPTMDCPIGNPFIVDTGQSPVCGTIVVDGEPCLKQAYLGFDHNPAKCSDPTAYYMQDAIPGDEFRLDYGAAHEELVELLAKNGNTWTIQRWVRSDQPPVSHPAGILLAATNHAGITAWDYLNDPHGLNLNGKTVVADLHGTGGHGSYHPSLSIEGGRQRRGMIPDYFDAIPSFIPEGGPFSGVGVNSGGWRYDYHPNFGIRNQWYVTARVWQGGGSGKPATKVVDNLYKYSSNAYGGSGTDVALHREQRPTIATCGRHPLQDISGPGVQLTATTADSFKYCIARNAGECHTGSAVGDVYVNCPSIEDGVQRDPACHNFGWNGYGGGEPHDMCMGDNGTWFESFLQQGVNAQDSFGRTGRMLSSGYSMYRLRTDYWNTLALPDGSWMMYQMDPFSYYGNLENQVLLAKIPPFPAPDALDRSDFLKIPVAVSPPAGTNNAVVQFGYVENGPPGNYFCTSRREACVKGNQSGTSYGYAGNTIAGVPCSGGCTVTIPALPERIVYFQALYRDASNNVIGQGPRQMTASSAPCQIAGENSSSPSSCTIPPMPPQNQPPSVTVSGPSSLSFGSPALLTASVSDDGLPVGSTVTLQWSKVDYWGPGSGLVSFLTDQEPNTQAVFSDPGTYIIRLDANDSQLTGSDQIKIEVTSATVTQPPVAADQNVTTYVQTPVNITVQAADPNNAKLDYLPLSFPLHGKILGALPSMTYLPDHGYSGSDSFTFKANNGTLDSNVATVSISVIPNPGHAPPTFTSVTALPSLTTGPVSLSASAVGGTGLLMYSWGIWGYTDLIGPSQTIVLTSAGQKLITATVTDSLGAVDISTLTVTVNPPHAPIFLSAPGGPYTVGQTYPIQTNLASWERPIWSADAGAVIDSAGNWTPSTTGPHVIQASFGGMTGEIVLSALPVGAANPPVAGGIMADPNPVTGSQATLSLAPTGGVGSLSYHWDQPPGTSLSDPSAASPVITFSQAGSHHLSVTVTDAQSQSDSSNLDISVKQTPSSAAITPPGGPYQTGTYYNFHAAFRDQFGAPMNSPTAMSWSVTPAVGATVDGTGAFMATAPGTYQVTVSTWTATASASITIPDPSALGLPVITSPGQAQGILGQLFAYQITATNNPTSYGLDGPLPTGLSFDPSSGLISGTPTALTDAVGARLTLEVSNGGGAGQSPLILQVGNPPAPTDLGSAVFVKQDATTQGSWQGVYGDWGSALINLEPFPLPTQDLLFNLASTPRWEWAKGWTRLTTDPRALQYGPAANERIASAWYSYSGAPMVFDIRINDGSTQRLAAYFLDWDNQRRVVNVSINDMSNNVLDSRTLSNFSGGIYLVWNVSGHVTMTVTGTRPVVNAFFFGNPAGGGGLRVSQITFSPNPVTGTQTTLNPIFSGGTPPYTFQWSQPLYTILTRTASNPTVTFLHAGNYLFSLLVTDSGGFSAPGSVTVPVPQTPTSIVITPPAPPIAVNQTVTFSASVLDQFTDALISQPAISWTVAGGGATIDNSGNFIASSAGTYTVQAVAGALVSATQVTVSSGAASPPGGLPQTLVLDIPDILTIDATLKVRYEAGAGYPNLQYVWTIAPEADFSAPVPALQIRGVSGGSSPVISRTPALALPLAPLQLGPGRYSVSVYATDGTDRSNVAAKNVTLVSADLNGVQVYPNPWRKDKHEGKPIVFRQLTGGAIVKLFTTSGREVRTLGPANGVLSWDLTNNSGEKVASGIYLYLISDAQGNHGRGKLAVIH